MSSSTTRPYSTPQANPARPPVRSCHAPSTTNVPESVRVGQATPTTSWAPAWTATCRSRTRVPPRPQTGAARPASGTKTLTCCPRLATSGSSTPRCRTATCARTRTVIVRCEMSWFLLIMIFPVYSFQSSYSGQIWKKNLWVGATFFSAPPRPPAPTLKIFFWVGA